MVNSRRTNRKGERCVPPDFAEAVGKKAENKSAIKTESGSDSSDDETERPKKKPRVAASDSDSDEDKGDCEDPVCLPNGKSRFPLF